MCYKNYDAFMIRNGVAFTHREISLAMRLYEKMALRLHVEKKLAMRL